MRFETDEVTAAGLAEYGPIILTVQLNYDSILTLGKNPIYNNVETVCYINDLEVTGKEWNTVWGCLHSAHSDKLIRGDFIDLGEVERILEKVCANAI